MLNRNAFLHATVAAMLAVLPGLNAAQYAGSSAITTWGGSCGGSTRDWWDDMCMAWRHKMADKGWTPWWRNFHLVQGNRYADNSAKSWGIDDTSSGMDWNDAGLMCMHGGWGSGRWNGSIYDQDPDGSCASSSDKMRLGWNSGGWLRFMHLSSCNSIRYSQRTQWFDAANGVHVITGFHGLMYIGSNYVDEYSDLADDAMNSKGVARCLARQHASRRPLVQLLEDGLSRRGRFRRDRAAGAERLMTRPTTRTGRTRRPTSCTRGGNRAAIPTTVLPCPTDREDAMNRILIALCATLLSTCATSASAQESPLGSSAQTVDRFTTNYAEAVRAALPKVNREMLTKLVENVRAAAAAEKPLAIANARDLQKLFSLRDRGQADSTDYVDAGEAVYKLAPDRIYVAWRTTESKPVPRAAFRTEIPAIRAAHESLAAQIGIPRQQVLFVDFREILSQTDGHPVLERGVQGEIQSEGGTTTLLRAVGGVLVEGSYARMTSVDGKRLAAVDVRWPRLQLSEAMRPGVRSPDELLEPIVRRVEQSAGQLPVNVRMAVVLRPTNKERPGDVVLSLKVGMTPKAVKTEQGFRTDAGEGLLRRPREGRARDRRAGPAGYDGVGEVMGPAFAFAG